MIIEATPEFAKDVKSLKKRFITISDDLVDLEKILKIKPKPSPPFSFHISGLGVTSIVVKVKKIACRALKGKGVNSGLRLVYALIDDEKRILLIEMYHKGDKELEDRERIERLLSRIE